MSARTTAARTAAMSGTTRIIRRRRRRPRPRTSRLTRARILRWCRCRALHGRAPASPTTPCRWRRRSRRRRSRPPRARRSRSCRAPRCRPTGGRLFGSAALDALVDRALAANNDLANADATLRQAREQARAAGGAGLPQVDASYQAQRIRVSRVFSNPLDRPRPISLHAAHRAGVGRLSARPVRRAAQQGAIGARRRRRSPPTELIAARTTVVANLVSAVIQQAALQAQIAPRNAAIQQQPRRAHAAPAAPGARATSALADVSAQQTALATAEGALPTLMRQRDHQRGLIATLLGLAAGSPLPPLPALAELTLPATMPVALPAQIVANRPDVRAAEAQMAGRRRRSRRRDRRAPAQHPAQRQCSAARRPRSPRLFASGNPFWTLIGGVTQPIFHGGQLLHQKRAAEAALDGAKAQYRGAALQAFLDVDDALSGLRTDADALDAATRADAAAAQTLALHAAPARTGRGRHARRCSTPMRRTRSASSHAGPGARGAAGGHGRAVPGGRRRGDDPGGRGPGPLARPSPGREPSGSSPG